MQSLRIRFLRYSAFYAPLLLTLPRLRAAGIDPVFDVVTPERTIAAGIADGTVDVAQSALAVSFAPAQQGISLPFRHFAMMNRFDGFFLVGRGIDAALGLHALVGKRVLVDHFFQPHAMFLTALRAHHIDPQSMSIIDAGAPAAMERAYRAGEADVLHAQGPVPHQLAAEGEGEVFASIGAAVGPVVFSTMCAAPAWLATPMAATFRDAFDAARADAQRDPPGAIAAAIAHHFPGVEHGALTRAITDYQRLGCWTGASRIEDALVDRTVEIFQQTGHIVGPVPRSLVTA